MCVSFVAYKQVSSVTQCTPDFTCVISFWGEQVAQSVFLPMVPVTRARSVFSCSYVLCRLFERMEIVLSDKWHNMKVLL